MLESNFKVLNKKIEYQTKGQFDFIDITDEVKAFVKESQIKNGFVNIQTLHTTAPLILNENEPLLLEDFKIHLEKLAPKNANYKHNDFTVRTINMCENECKNGHSHCQALHLSPNIVLNIINEELQLGQWQRIFLVELDSMRKRNVQIQALGD